MISALRRIKRRKYKASTVCDQTASSLDGLARMGVAKNIDIGRKKFG